MLLVITIYKYVFFVFIFQGIGGLNGEPGRQGKDGPPVRTYVSPVYTSST